MAVLLPESTAAIERVLVLREDAGDAVEVPGYLLPDRSRSHLDLDVMLPVAWQCVRGTTLQVEVEYADREARRLTIHWVSKAPSVDAFARVAHVDTGVSVDRVQEG